MTASLPYDDVYNKAAAPAFESPRAIQQRINEGREEDGSRKLGFRRKGFYSPAGPAFNPSPIAWMTDKDFPWEVCDMHATCVRCACDMRATCMRHACDMQGEGTQGGEVPRCHTLGSSVRK